MNLSEVFRTRGLGLLLEAGLLGGCGKETTEDPTAPTPPAPALASASAAEAKATPDVAFPGTGIAAIALAKWTGDLDGMIERRYFRVLTTYSHTQFFIDKWFNNVEIIAAERIGRETVQYVSNSCKYYLTYQMAVEQMEARKAAMRTQHAQ